MNLLNRSIKILTLILISLIVLFGCGNNDLGIYVVPTKTPEIPKPSPTLIPNYYHDIVLGSYTVRYYDNGSYSNLTNCGQEAYGPLLINNLETLNADDFELFITNNSVNWIGGCKDVIIEYQPKVIIMTPPTDSRQFQNIIYWTLPENLVYR